MMMPPPAWRLRQLCLETGVERFLLVLRLSTKRLKALFRAM